MFKKIICLVCIAMLSLSLFGCLSSKHKIYEEGYFRYIIVGKNSRFPKDKKDEVIAIIGLTASGQEQEVIDFPRVLVGKNVKHIGYGPKTQGLFTGGYYHIESPNLRKIYLHDNIESIGKEVFGSIPDLSIMVCGAKPIAMNESYLLFVYQELYAEADGHYYIMENGTKIYYWLKENLKPANIEFLNNYSDEINKGYYRLDNIESGEKIPQPPVPEREDYEFTGWFTEPECLNIWDFNTVLEIAEDTEFRLYAGWQTK